MSATEGMLTGLLILATAVWLGGLVTIAIVARVATRSGPGAFRDVVTEAAQYGKTAATPPMRVNQ